MQWAGYKPRLLRLKAEDICKMHGAPLHKARFSAPAGPARCQDYIVASIASYTLLFSFRCLPTQAGLPPDWDRPGLLHGAGAADPQLL